MAGEARKILGGEQGEVKDILVAEESQIGRSLL
jgi:hypothetical protein